VSRERRSEILDASVRVFARLGFKGARMDDIVRESRLSKGTLYWYFKGKDAIIAAVMERLFAPEVADLERRARMEGPVAERVMEFARATAREIRGMTRVIPITFEFYSLAFRNKAVRGVVKRFFAAFVESLQAIIEQGIEQGELRVADARETAAAIAALIEGTFLLWVFDRETLVLDRQLEAGIGLILAGLEKRRNESETHDLPTRRS
jgi:AcrR family transcriptional regulator